MNVPRLRKQVLCIVSVTISLGESSMNQDNFSLDQVWGRADSFSVFRVLRGEKTYGIAYPGEGGGSTHR